MKLLFATRLANYLLFTLSFVAVSLSQEISDTHVLRSSTSNAETQTFIVEVVGTNLSSAAEQPRVVIFPSPSTDPKVISKEDESGLVRVEFTAPNEFQLQQVSLSYKATTKSIRVAQNTCQNADDVVSSFNFVDNSQVKNKYGNGVAKNFYVIQLSIVNKCSLGIIVPLAGIAIDALSNSADQQAAADREPILIASLHAPILPVARKAVPATSTREIVPYTLDHVTSVYSTDRKLTGARAIWFNSLQALATLGSSIQPFFGHGFTQGVSILGGGFTNAAQTILKDMSAEQLQNITTQSFGNTEQIAANGGSVSKFLFIPKRVGEPGVQKALDSGTVKLDFQFTPAVPTPTKISAQKE